MAKQTIAGWIHEAFADRDKSGPLTMMSLMHMVGMQQQEIHTTKFGGSSDLSTEKLGELFRNKAENYCQDLPGVQTFVLLAFYNNKTEPEAKHPFIVNVNFDHGNGLSTENPTNQGAMQQQMRHAEMLIQQVYRRQQAQDDFQIRFMQQHTIMVDNLLTRLDKAIEGQMDANEIVMEMMRNQQLDDHKLQLERLTFERQTAERKKWLAFAPPLINQLLGREVFPQATEDTALVEQIAEAIKPEDIEKLSSLLPPEMWGPLASRFSKAIKKKEDEQKALAALMPPAKDPVADASGNVQPSTQMVPSNGRH